VRANKNLRGPARSSRVPLDQRPRSSKFFFFFCCCCCYKILHLIYCRFLFHQQIRLNQIVLDFFLRRGLVMVCSLGTRFFFFFFWLLKALCSDTQPSHSRTHSRSGTRSAVELSVDHDGAFLLVFD
jgi:hypothetical protein